MDGLQSQFHGYGLAGVDLFQKGDHRIPQAVRPGSDGKADDFFRGDGLKIQLPQRFHRGIGVGKGLKIGDVFAAFVFGGDPGLCPLQLRRDGLGAADRKFAAAGAEDAATGTQGAVPVGAGESAVQRQFIDLAAEFLPVMVGKGFQKITSGA